MERILLTSISQRFPHSFAENLLIRYHQDFGVLAYGSGLKLNFFNHLPRGPVSLTFYWPAKYSNVPLFSCKLLVFFKAFINRLVK